MWSRHQYERWCSSVSPRRWTIGAKAPSGLGRIPAYSTLLTHEHGISLLRQIQGALIEAGLGCFGLNPSSYCTTRTATQPLLHDSVLLHTLASRCIVAYRRSNLRLDQDLPCLTQGRRLGYRTHSYIRVWPLVSDVGAPRMFVQSLGVVVPSISQPYVVFGVR